MTGTTLTTNGATKKARASTIAKPIRQLTPSVDVFENQDEYLLLADMPGATAESVAVQIEGRAITIEAQRTMPSGSQRYRRMFQLPSMIDPDGISAELRDGVLHVHIKKAEQAKRRVISIRSS